MKEHPNIVFYDYNPGSCLYHKSQVVAYIAIMPFHKMFCTDSIRIFKSGNIDLFSWTQISHQHRDF